jgi:hypothetical protein
MTASLVWFFVIVLHVLAISNLDVYTDALIEDINMLSTSVDQNTRIIAEAQVCIVCI